jgi:hypothetical protein
VLPLTESAEDLDTVLSGMFNACCGRKADHHLGNPDAVAKEDSEEDEVAEKADDLDGVDAVEAVEEDEA